MRTIEQMVLLGLKIWLYLLNKSLDQELKITISSEKTKISHFGTLVKIQ